MTKAKPPPQDPDKPAGQVRHDSTGRAVWEWAAASGRHALESTSRLLKRLDMPGLTLEGDDSAPPASQTPTNKGAAGKGSPAAGVPALPPPGQRGFNPYDRKLPARSAEPQASQVKRPAAPAPKPGLLGKLFGRKP